MSRLFLHTLNQPKKHAPKPSQGANGAKLHRLLQGKLSILNMHLTEAQFTPAPTIKISAFASLHLLANFSIILQSKLTKTSRFVTKASIIKDGNYYTIENKDKAGHVEELINCLSENFKYGCLRIHPSKHTFETIISYSANPNFLKKKPVSDIIDQLTEDMQQALRYTSFNIYRILYLVGEVDQSVFHILKSQEIRVRKLPEMLGERMDQVIRDLIWRKQNKKPLLEAEQLSAFRTRQALPKTFGWDELKGFRADYIMRADNKGQKSTGSTKDTDKTTITSSEGRKVQLSSIAIYEPLLKQFPYPNSQYENPAVYSEIIFQKTDGKDNVNWELILDTEHTRLSKCSARFYSSGQYPKGPIPQDRYLKKFLIKKEATGVEAKKKSQYEKRILKNLTNWTSVNIAKFYWIGDRQKEYETSIVMDLYSESSCDIYAKENSKSMTVRTKLLIIPPVVQGARFLRDCNLIHMDLKFQNVLIGRGLIVRLTDFGQSLVIKDKKGQRRGYTLPYTCPEHFYKTPDKLTNSVDTYSIGVMIDFFLTNQHILPFRKNSQNWLKESLQNPKNPRYINLLSFCPEKYLGLFPPKICTILWTTFLLCLHPDPTKRPNQDILCILLKVCQKFLDDLFS